MDKLEYIIAIAEEHNLTRAAERLFISQPALTLYLNRLENELGVKLFDRSKKPIVLTEAGHYYVEESKKLVAHERAMRSNLLAIAEPQSQLSIGIGQVRGQYWLPSILESFCNKHPNVNIRAGLSTEDEMLDDVRANKIDVAVGAFPLDSSGVASVELSHGMLLIAAHKKFELIPSQLREQYGYMNPYPLAAVALNGLPIITPQNDESLYGIHQDFVDSNGILPGRRISINNLNIGLHLAARGLGIYMLYRSIVTSSGLDNLEDIDFCTLENRTLTRRCVAIYREANINRDMIMEVINILKYEVLPQYAE